MNVVLLSCNGRDVLYDAVGVCQNTDDKVRALQKALKAGHESLLEHVNFTFKIQGISRACSHQLVRHRIASYAQESQRYVKINSKEKWFVVPPSLENVPMFYMSMQVFATQYNKLLDEGIPKEDARFVLPNATKTQLVMTINARSLMNFFTLRLCTKAQWEIRELAEKMLIKVAPWLPEVFHVDMFPKCHECLAQCKNRRYDA